MSEQEEQPTFLLHRGRATRRADHSMHSSDLLPGASDRMSRLVAIFKLIRPHQWLKNGLVFLPMIAGHRWFEAATVLNTALAFSAFCLVASAAYVLNDLIDAGYDRLHPRKRRRPIASRAVSRRLALKLIVALLAGGITLALLLPVEVVGVLAGYFVLTTLYSVLLKKLALIDILVLNILYHARIIAGGTASGIVLSHWLIGFTVFLFFALAVMKRVTEVRDINLMGDDAATGRGYLAGDEHLLLPLGIACTVTAAVVLGLYTASPDVHELYSRPVALMLVVPLVLLWQCRLWLATVRGQMHDDPLVYAVQDPATWLVISLAGVFFLYAL